ncbi:MAG: PD40 domain-containing protein [Bacteroidales bacterium]|nr:PD40 domain-containing protein [Bacteroidales bacterium]
MRKCLPIVLLLLATFGVAGHAQIPVYNYPSTKVRTTTAPSTARNKTAHQTESKSQNRQPITDTPQDVPSEAKQIYANQFHKLNKAYIQKPHDVAVLKNLAIFYCDTLNPAYNLPLSMDYICQAEAIYRSMINDNHSYGEMRRLQKKQITLATLREDKQRIVQQARTEIEKSESLSESEISRYSEAFKDENAISRGVRKERLKNAFQSALQQNTIEAYYNFKITYAGTAEADTAEVAIEKLAPYLFDPVESESEATAIARMYEKSPAIQKQAQRHKSKIAYATARTRHSVESYRAFLSAYPSSDEYLQALDEMESLLEDQYKSLSSVQDYIDFIEHNNDSELSEAAMERLCQIIQEEQNVEAAKAYLAHFPLDKHYNDIYRLYYEWHAAEGNLQPIQAFANSQKDYPFKTALHQDLSEAAQIDAFNLMRPYADSRKSEYVEFIRQHTGKRITFVALQRMIQPFRARRDWKGASEQMGYVMLSFEDVCARQFDELRKLITEPAPNSPKAVSIYSVAQNISHPVRHPADNSLYYTVNNGHKAKIQMTFPTINGKWSKPVDVIFSNAENEGMTIYNFFDNGSKMLLGKDGDIWIAEREGEQWRIGEIPPYPVNTDFVETDAFMLPDGTGLLLASDRPGGYNLQTSHAKFHGDTALASDIYFIPRTLKGWGRPINLGSNINTTYAERSPILSKDQKTLYFISDGHGGLGYGEILMSTRANSDDWTQWSHAVNIGREANSCYDEASVTFDAEETHLLTASNQNNGHFECYSIKALHEATNSSRQVNIDARHFGKVLTELSVADFTLQALTHEITFPDASKPISLNLYRGKKYVVYGKANGYFVPALLINEETAGNIRLQGYPADQLTSLSKPIDLPTILFDAETAQPKTISVTEIEYLSQFLKSHPRLRLELMINVSGTNARQCFETSIERGQNLRRYISSLGIDISRIDISGNGNSLQTQHRANGTTMPEVSIRFHND